MSTADLSPLEQLSAMGSQQTQATPSDTQPTDLSPLEQLMQGPTQPPAPKDVGTTVKPESSMVDQVMGALAPHIVPKTKGAGLKQGDEGGFEGSLASGDQGKANFMSGAGGATLLTMLGASYGPEALEAMKAAADSHPLVAKLLAHALANTGTLTVAKYLHMFGK